MADERLPGREDLPRHIRENLKKLPDKPGVYLHRDKMGTIIYVGKAVSLKNRVRQYFQSKKNMDAKVRAMVGHIADFEYIVCGSEMEAFILENNLIKQHQPKYNILLRDDKTYPYVKITTNEEWPRLLKTRLVGKDKAKYFGPYSDVGAVNDVIRLLNDVFVLKRCATPSFKPGAKPCLNYHIGKCEGICLGNVDHDAYMERVEKAAAYFSGKDRSVEHYLKKLMLEASESLDFETAAKYRDHLLAAQALREGQRVTLKQDVDLDAVLTVGPSHMAVFFVRDGKLSGREVFDIQAEDADSAGERTGAFIQQYYGAMTDGPAEILVADMPEDAVLIEEFLSATWNRKVHLLKPERGEKRALLALATGNRDAMLRNMEGRDERNRKKEDRLKDRLVALFQDMDTQPDWMRMPEAQTLAEDSVPAPPDRLFRVEAYDISNTNGIDTVAAMVVFRGLKPDRRAYRKFKIRTDMPGDDYAAMQEVLYRRFKRALAGDPGFKELPDLLVIDGGKGHLHAARQILTALQLEIPAVGAVKDDHHRTRGLVYVPQRATGMTASGAEIEGSDAIVREATVDPLADTKEIDLRQEPFLFSYIGTMQEEVHRFVIEYHRKIRDTKSLVSVLDEIPGIGPKKRTALLRQFGSVEAVKSASEEELMETPGITKANATAIRNFFSGRESQK